MNAKPLRRTGGSAWDPAVCAALIDELGALRKSMIDYELRLAPWARDLDDTHVPSASNLAHYLAMRRVDMRRLQERLARIGVSSLGRAETHVLANLDKVLGILHMLAGRDWFAQAHEEPTGYTRGRALLDRNAEMLFGAPPEGRAVRVMVTMPTQAAFDSVLVDALVAGGMDIARINCAHDEAPHWIEMARRVRKAARAARRPVKILMDLGGPKLRTGPLPDGAAVLKLKQPQDDYGRLTFPLRVGLRPSGSATPVPGAQAHVNVDAHWLVQLRAGDKIDLADARGAERRLIVIRTHRHGALVECSRTTYLTPATALRIHRKDADPRESLVDGIIAEPGEIALNRGDRLRLVRDGLGQPARVPGSRRAAEQAVIACTLPQVFDAVCAGQRIWFDDGRIGGVIRRRTAKAVEVEITVARDGGEHLREGKGINLPDTELSVPALSDKDIADLAVAAGHADMVGLSFAQSADDVRSLRQHLQALGASHLGLLLKIETKRGFEHLPEMLFAAMGTKSAGVMIARGDLAIECGYERMAEVQEEILWACEAAHVPVVWATQVLETLAKTGLPSRAEITDAAMGERAECVMLNKGPYIVDALRMLDDILRRMQSHQRKKQPQMRALKSWRAPPLPDEPGAG